VWFILVLVSSCYTSGIIEPPNIQIEVDSDSVVFAVIGDYGSAGPGEEAVASMVKSWQPDFIITTGDNNYEYGEYATLQQNIGNYYGEFIYNFDAPTVYRCTGRASHDQLNRFFPSPGNHDEAGARGLEPYLNYFTLPGNESYYTFTWGEAAFFSVNSLRSSDLEKQQRWLETALKESDKPFKIVYFHHSPYSPGTHGDTYHMQWEFHRWGADVVIGGHDHIYARLKKRGEEGLQYIINGLGGKSRYALDRYAMHDEVELIKGYNEDFGAIKGTVFPGHLKLVFYSIAAPTVPVDSLDLIR
jgi:hypothetical protein